VTLIRTDEITATTIGGAGAAPSAGAGPRTVSAGALRARVLTGTAALAPVVPRWLELFARSDLGNANLHPAWMLAWYEVFVRDRDVVVVTVHAGDELVGVAPLWRMRLLPRFGRPAALQLAGAGRHVLLTDTPGVLTATGSHRKVVKAVADELATVPGWSWCTLTLSPRQGWSDQLAAPGVSCVVPRVGRACVVSPLPATADAFDAQLKRNVRESIRRSANRLKRSGEAWSVERVPGSAPAFGAALDETVALHGRRARLSAHKGHRDVFADGRYARLLATAAAGPGGADLMTVYTLRVGGRALAAQVVLHAPASSTLLVSGIHPDGWQYSPLALITREIARDGIAAGRTRLDHSAGPDTGKLRWSEELETYPEFSVVRTDRRHRLAFLAHSHAAIGAGLRRERRRAGPPGPGA